MSVSLFEVGETGYVGQCGPTLPQGIARLQPTITAYIWAMSNVEDTEFILNIF